MSDTSKKKANEALLEYLEAVDNHKRLLDKHFPVRPEIPGVPITFGEPFTEAVLKEFEEAGAKVTEALQKWNDALRRLYY